MHHRQVLGQVDHARGAREHRAGLTRAPYMDAFTAPRHLGGGHNTDNSTNPTCDHAGTKNNDRNKHTRTDNNDNSTAINIIDNRTPQ